MEKASFLSDHPESLLQWAKLFFFFFHLPHWRAGRVSIKIWNMKISSWVSLKQNKLKKNFVKNFLLKWDLSQGHSEWQPEVVTIRTATRRYTKSMAYSFLLSLYSNRRLLRLDSTVELDWLLLEVGPSVIHFAIFLKTLFLYRI